MGGFDFTSLISPVPSIVTKLLDFIPDPNARAKAAEEYQRAVLEAQTKAEADQREINMVEAASSSVFVAGWRPSLGWICSISLGIYYIPRFALGTGFWCWACIKAGALVPMPEMGIAEVVGLVMSLLGIGTLRTIEKAKGLTR